MIRNTSNNNKQASKDIISLVGKTFSFENEPSGKDSYLPRFTITKASETISSLLSDKAYMNTCTIEIHSGGLVIEFRVGFETFTWSIPFYKLTIYHLGGNLVFYSDKEYIQLRNTLSSDETNNYLQKILDVRAEYLTASSQYN
jgi:hypothetical protein